MIILLLLALVVAGPALINELIVRLEPTRGVRWHAAAKIGVSLLFLLTGITHFVATHTMARMLPPFVPRRTEIVYLTGAFELAGAAAIWIPRIEQAAGACLVALIIAVLPANLYTALHHLPIAGHQDGVRYLLARIPFEIFLIVWVYRATRQAWAGRFWQLRK